MGIIEEQEQTSKAPSDCILRTFLQVRSTISWRESVFVGRIFLRSINMNYHAKSGTPSLKIE